MWMRYCSGLVTGPVKLVEDIGVLLKRGSTKASGRIFVVVASCGVSGVEGNWYDGEEVSGNGGTSGFWEAEGLSREFSEVKPDQ